MANNEYNVPGDSQQQHQLPPPPPYYYNQNLVINPNNFANTHQFHNQPHAYLPYNNPGYEHEINEKHMPINSGYPPGYNNIPYQFNQNVVIGQPPVVMAQQVTQLIYQMRYTKLHLIYGTFSIIFGGIIMIIDPLLPAIFRYIYSIFCVGLFMMISGICSILGSRKNNKCCLVASLVFNIFSSILVIIGYSIGLLVTSISRNKANCFLYNCISNSDYYANGVFGLGIFNSIFGMIIFVFLIWDSSLKCGDVCCIKRVAKPITNDPNVEVININT